MLSQLIHCYFKKKYKQKIIKLFYRNFRAESSEVIIGHESFINRLPSDTIKPMCQMERAYTKNVFAQLAWAVEYTGCFSAER